MTVMMTVTKMNMKMKKKIMMIINYNYDDDDENDGGLDDWSWTRLIQLRWFEVWLLIVNRRLLGRCVGDLNTRHDMVGNGKLCGYPLAN